MKCIDFIVIMTLKDKLNIFKDFKGCLLIVSFRVFLFFLDLIVF